MDKEETKVLSASSMQGMSSEDDELSEDSSHESKPINAEIPANGSFGTRDHPNSAPARCPKQDWTDVLIADALRSQKMGNHLFSCGEYVSMRERGSGSASENHCLNTGSREIAFLAEHDPFHHDWPFW